MSKKYRQHEDKQTETHSTHIPARKYLVLPKYEEVSNVGLAGLYYIGWLQVFEQRKVITHKNTTAFI